jgi:hypothetical protein
MPVGRRLLPGRDLGDAAVNVAVRPDEKKGAADGDHVAVAEDPHLDVLAVDLRAVGALQVGGDDLVAVVLEFEVIPADPLVVQLDRIAVLAADRDRRGHVFKHTAAVGAMQDAESDQSHVVYARGRARFRG